MAPFAGPPSLPFPDFFDSPIPKAAPLAAAAIPAVLLSLRPQLSVEASQPSSVPSADIKLSKPDRQLRDERGNVPHLSAI